MRALFLTCIGCVLAACNGPSVLETGSPVTLSSSQVPAADLGRARLASLEQRLELGRTWGSDATAKDMAASVVGTLVQTDWYDSSDVAVAVEILPYAPRKIVVLVKMKSIAEETKDDRRGLLRDVQNALKDKAQPRDELAIGIRGPHGYVAVATGRADGEWETQTGKSVPLDPLQRALATSR